MIIKKIMPKIPNIKKRVAAYCRVSTLREDQEDSFETQRSCYSNMIENHPEWKLVKIYADRHSATKVENRPGFQEMVADAQARKLDIILCKSISRFSRNVVDCQQYTKWFRTLGITVIFEEQDIRTDDPTSDFILSMMAAVAQDESHSISANVQLAYEHRFARGEYNLGNNRILGYDSRDGVLIPNHNAWVVREIFKRFLEGQSFREISNGLVKMGAKSQRGKDYFSSETIRYMLSNETYAGDKFLQKQPPRDYITKKPDPNRVYKTNYLTDDHEAIIDRSTWNAVQEILKQREADNSAGIYRRGKEHHAFYGKVFCGECGSPFVRRTYLGKSGQYYKAWNCKERQKGKKGNGCMNVIVKENALMQMVEEKLEEVDADKLKSIERIIVFKDRVETISSTQPSYSNKRLNLSNRSI